ncbi:30S ribosomal protein S16 [Patescibacteria group bacterium]|nr:30S ribosomal protein S16 [Patescibacteria group bacterium]
MIRLQRKGKKHQPFYRLVVGEKRSKLNGQQVEELGWFDPLQSKNHVDAERVKHWLSMGAKMSPTVNNLLISAGVVTGKKIAVHNVPKKAAEAAAPAEAKA